MGRGRDWKDTKTVKGCYDIIASYKAVHHEDFFIPYNKEGLEFIVEMCDLKIKWYNRDRDAAEKKLKELREAELT